jgi:predicted transcriptional regulator
MTTIKTSIRIDATLAAKLSKLARELGISDSEAMRSAITRGLEMDESRAALEKISAQLDALAERNANIESALAILIKRLVPT